MNPDKTYAFLIAVNKYTNDKSLHELPHAYSNVKKLFEKFNSHEIGIPRTNITTITNPDNAKKLLTKLREMAGSSGIKNLIIYYAGHGILDDDNNHYLTLTDSTVDNIDLDGLDIADITKSLSKNKRLNVFMILDSCFSENAFSKFDARNFLLMASSAKNRTSKYPVDADYSAFTNELVYAIEHGIENEQEYLSWRDVFNITRDKLADKGFPKPKLLIQNEVDELKLVKNLKIAQLTGQPGEDVEEKRTVDVGKILDDHKREQARVKEKQLGMLSQLLEEYQDLLIMEEMPKKRMKFEKEIDSLKEQMTKKKEELIQLAEE